MAYSLVVYEEFETDLDRIIDYHVNDLHAPRAAAALLEDLDRIIGMIAELPTINAISSKPLLAELGYREQQVRSYVVVYRFDDEAVYIARMFHLTQDFGSLFQDSSQRDANSKRDALRNLLGAAEGRLSNATDDELEHLKQSRFT